VGLLRKIHPDATGYSTGDAKRLDAFLAQPRA
jgi:hypothetical protein